MNRVDAPGRGNEMLFVMWTLTSVSGLVLALRIYCKISRHRGMWWDDYLLVVSWILLLVPSALTTVQIQLGYGEHSFNINPANIHQLALLGQFAASLSILGALWSKTAFAITLLRLTTGWTKLVVWTTITTMNAFMILSVILEWIQCTPTRKIWMPDVPGICWNPQVVLTYNTFAGAYSGAMDIALALLPWTIIPQLQMQTKEKVGIAIAMSMGIFAGATAFVKCIKLQAIMGADVAFASVDLVEWAAAETATTIIAASLPVLRVLSRTVLSSAISYRSRSKNATRLQNQNGTTNTDILAMTRTRSEYDDLVTDTSSVKSILPAGKGHIRITTRITTMYIDPNDARNQDMKWPN